MILMLSLSILIFHVKVLMPLVLPLPLCRALSQRLLELRSLSSKALVGHYLLNEAIFDFTLCPCPISPNAVSVSLILLADLVFVGLTFSAGLSDPKWQRILSLLTDYSSRTMLVTQYY